MADAAFELKQIRDQAASWYARLNNTTISTDTLRAFREWRRTDERHDEAYLEIEAFWKRVAQLENDQEIQRAAGAALERPAEAPKTGPLGRPGGKSLAAAFFALLLVAALTLSWPRLFGETYASGVGEQRILRLKDGSQLRLDTASRVRVKLTDDARRVRLLGGRAFFDVAHDPSRPFTVVADGASVTALGTRFDVRRDTADVTVTLFQGQVKVEGGEAPVVLQPGQRAIVTGAGSRSLVRSVNAAEAQSWTQGQLVFRQQTLGAAAAEVNRYSETQVVIRDADLANRTVSGVFESGDTDAFVAAVADLFDLEVDRSQNEEIVLRRAG
ncbi:MAG: FecR family protein [Phenylobacterium sp.]|uniref:FecR family protein n=1 Tax=Phenylobacterium sp. TaxID=1871053 RepID=UPI0017F902AC|nr:FecR family protein [Phenylobacterium sp.]MBA4794665.1 FecR family protein [Phenylobacterium sp.]